MTKANCDQVDCGQPVHCKRLCRKHYNAAYHAANREKLLADMKVRSAAYYAAHREAVIARTTAYAMAHPEWRRAVARAGYARHREEGQARAAAWRAANPERYRESYTAYQREHPQAMRLKRHKRRTRLRANGTFDVTARDLVRLFNRYSGRCAYCGIELDEKFDWDHVLPISRGGRHSLGNLVPACQRCNRSKHNRTVTEWRVREMRRALLAV